MTIVSGFLLLMGCSDNSFESSAQQAVLDDETADNVSTCASRLGRSSEDLIHEIKAITDKDVFTIATEASGIDAENFTWDNSGVDVICTEETNDIYSVNLIQVVGEGQLVYGSSSTEYIGLIDGGTVYGFDGQDIVANLNSGTFYGGNGADLIDTPLEQGLYTGWAYVSVSSDGMSGGDFYGEDGNDFVAEMSGGRFYGESDDDSVAKLDNGKFYGGTGSDSLSNPYSGSTGEMHGGEFHGEDGNDWADNVSGGKIFGGAGHDLVQNLTSAEFDGMDGNDTVYSLNKDAIFNGGADSDNVDSMTGGLFDGGDGIDSVEAYSDGELINVE